jgi:hypothetical protein
MDFSVTIPYKRPDGMSLIPWSRGRCVVWDVTAPDTLAPSHVQASATNAGAAAAKAETSKNAKYSSFATTHIFIPLAFETFGAWGEQAQRFVSDLGKRVSAVTGDVRESMYLRQRLSLAIQRGNALSLRGTMTMDKSD